jgi:hypothetical protein
MAPSPPAAARRVMLDLRVIDIDYRGPTGLLLLKDKQCAYAVENCVK